MTPVTDNVWLEQYGDEKAVRADFSNDRHYRRGIQEPHGPEQLAHALMAMAHDIFHDQYEEDNKVRKQ